MQIAKEKCQIAYLFSRAARLLKIMSENLCRKKIGTSTTDSKNWLFCDVALQEILSVL